MLPHEERSAARAWAAVSVSTAAAEIEAKNEDVRMCVCSLKRQTYPVPIFVNPCSAYATATSRKAQEIRCFVKIEPRARLPFMSQWMEPSQFCHARETRARGWRTYKKIAAPSSRDRKESFDLLGRKNR